MLTEAVLALEAEVQRSPSNAEAWRLLGKVQAENDDDTQAIAALNMWVMVGVQGVGQGQLAHLWD